MLYLTKDVEGFLLWEARPVYDPDLEMWVGEHYCFHVDDPGIDLAPDECKMVGLYEVVNCVRPSSDAFAVALWRRTVNLAAAQAKYFEDV